MQDCAAARNTNFDWLRRWLATCCSALYSPLTNIRNNTTCPLYIDSHCQRHSRKELFSLLFWRIPVNCELMYLRGFFCETIDTPTWTKLLRYLKFPTHPYIIHACFDLLHFATEKRVTFPTEQKKDFNCFKRRSSLKCIESSFSNKPKSVELTDE